MDPMIMAKVQEILKRYGIHDPWAVFLVMTLINAGLMAVGPELQKFDKYLDAAEDIIAIFRTVIPDNDE